MSQQNSSKPIKDFRAGNIQASIWKKEVDQQGQNVIRYSVRIQKQFRKEDGNYENTEYYFRDDLPKLILVAQKAYEHIALKASKDSEDQIPV
jgi:hypothetical protein